MRACCHPALPQPARPGRGRRRAGAVLAAVLVPAAAAASAHASPLDAALQRELQAQLLQAAVAQPALPPGARVQVELGRLDPRLRLAPCARIEHQPAGPPWGRTRITLRCAEGARRWQVQLPATVQVHAGGWVARSPLAAGTTLAAEHLQAATVDIAAGALQAPVGSEPPLGRTLARPLAAGETLRSADLRARRWFGAGETVQLVAVGRGWHVSGQGQALGAGVEGQRVRVRTGGGRIVTGTAVAAGRVEVVAP